MNEQNKNDVGGKPSTAVVATAPKMGDYTGRPIESRRDPIAGALLLNERDRKTGTVYANDFVLKTLELGVVALFGLDGTVFNPNGQVGINAERLHALKPELFSTFVERLDEVTQKYWLDITDEQKFIGLGAPYAVRFNDSYYLQPQGSGLYPESFMANWVYIGMSESSGAYMFRNTEWIAPVEEATEATEVSKGSGVTK